ncbi:Glycine cleavage system H protein (modular protein) [Hyphomicrobium sp. MC1]|nr:Glycine cleavage system H protein (modular protein) [Hyphomicrobium sp. MC1]
MALSPDGLYGAQRRQRGSEDDDEALRTASARQNYISRKWGSQAVPGMIYFTQTHQWLRFDGNIACTGISDYAAQALGEIISFETHDLGTRIKKGDVIAVIETANTVEKYHSLIEGEVVELNSILDKTPGLIGSSPEGEGWFVKLRIEALPDTDAENFIHRRVYLDMVASALAAKLGKAGS